ncbi:GIN domain-containing protein [Flavobacterium crassostreae]|uniref:Putative auto-transporter adhesin head GIN domain-containing protein n=1 Tax=Flavobacterium crassostreae TaxID=1763534 RepID=A0A1B9E3E9_9FLAO|nr:DUF2807 domain-containing protein [Flavobacterium crassostreae]OCB76472.1 hypothetical protein LPBF_05910 [Flavobacterium crassostreae]
MKKITTLLLLTLFTSIAVAQKKEKIKGSKKVTTEQKDISSFSVLEISDNIEVHLEKGENAALEIEADDNLHDLFVIESNEKALRVSTNKEASRYKKMVVKITYTNKLRSILAKNDTEINAIQEIIVDSLKVTSLDNAKVFMNAKVTDFVLETDDKSKVELNLKASKARLVLSKDSALKALIATTDLTCDLYQKAEAKIEGDATNATLRLDHNAQLVAEKLVVKNIALTTESYSTGSVHATKSIVIQASDKSEIALYGNAKIDLGKFTDEVKLFKKK